MTYIAYLDDLGHVGPYLTEITRGQREPCLLKGIRAIRRDGARILASRPNCLEYALLT